MSTKKIKVPNWKKLSSRHKLSLLLLLFLLIVLPLAVVLSLKPIQLLKPFASVITPIKPPTPTAIVTPIGGQTPIATGHTSTPPPTPSVNVIKVTARGYVKNTTIKPILNVYANYQPGIAPTSSWVTSEFDEEFTINLAQNVSTIDVVFPNQQYNAQNDSTSYLIVNKVTYNGREMFPNLNGVKCIYDRGTGDRAFDGQRTDVSPCQQNMFWDGAMRFTNIPSITPPPTRTDNPTPQVFEDIKVRLSRYFLNVADGESRLVWASTSSPAQLRVEGPSWVKVYRIFNSAIVLVSPPKGTSGKFYASVIASRSNGYGVATLEINVY